MAEIVLRVDVARDLTVFVARGRINAADIERAVERFCAGQPTVNVLWDLADASTADLTSGDARGLVQIAARIGEVRHGGRTAIVGPSDATFGLARMFATLAEINRLPVEYRSFRSRRDAHRWLGEGLQHVRAMPPQG